MRRPVEAEQDAVVVGAGPAGSATALLLARLGYRVTILDRARFPRNKSCAEYMSPGVMAALESLGVARAVRRAGPLPVPGMDIVSHSGRMLRVEYRTEQGAVSAFTLPRRDLDACLLSQAVDAGVDVREGVVVRSPLLESGVVRGVRGSSDGRPVAVRARLTIVSDGARSGLAQQLGLARPAIWPRRLGLVAHYEGNLGLEGGFGQMHVGLNGYCGVAPLPRGRYNVAMVLPVHALRGSSATATQHFEHWVSAHPRLARLLSAARRVTPVRGVSPVGARAKPPWTSGALLVGDAAGFFDPFTGEGIYRALKGAELAAGVADTALSTGDVSAERLARYGTLRCRAFRRKEAVTALVQLFVQHPRLMDYALPRLRRREPVLRTLGLVLGDVSPADSFLNPRMLWTALRP